MAKFIIYEKGYDRSGVRDDLYGDPTPVPEGATLLSKDIGTQELDQWGTADAERVERLPRNLEMTDEILVITTGARLMTTLFYFKGRSAPDLDEEEMAEREALSARCRRALLRLGTD